MVKSVPEPKPATDASSEVGRRHVLKMCALAATAFGLGVGGNVLTEAMAGEGRSALGVGQRELMTAIADTIIPDTDTPGAVKAGVPDFIDIMVTFWLSEAERSLFVTGLDQFGQETQRRYGKAFAQLSATERLGWLKAVQADAWAKRGPGMEPPFFLWMKRLTVFGYYTSEIGAAEELTLNLVPGEYQPCAHLGPDHAFSINRSGFVFPVGNDPVSF